MASQPTQTKGSSSRNPRRRDNPAPRAERDQARLPTPIMRAIKSWQHAPPDLEATHVTDEELANLQETFRDWQAGEQRIQQLQQQVLQAREAATMAKGGYARETQRMGRKYGLAPEDGVNLDDGAIIRNHAANPTVQPAPETKAEEPETKAEKQADTAEK